MDGGKKINKFDFQIVTALSIPKRLDKTEKKYLCQPWICIQHKICMINFM